MAILKILTFPNPVLKSKSRHVEVFDASLRALAADMVETMYAAPGVGLAAPQIGELVRFLVIDTRPRSETGEILMSEMSEFEKRLSWPLYLANPEIIKSEGTFQFEEGCLSIPGYHEWVDRKKNVTVRAQNLDGEFFEFEADGLLSVCIQHEIDHLDGRLFLDRISMVKSTLLKNKIRKKGYPKHTESRNPL